MSKKRKARPAVKRGSDRTGKVVKDLTPKQQAFVAEYRVDLNATQAAKRAGYSAKTAMQQGQRLLRNAVIGRAIAEITRQQLDKVGLTAESVLEAIRRQVQGDIRTLFRPDGSLKPITELTEEEASLIAGFEVIKKNAEAGDGHMDTVHKVKLKDQSRYVEMAAKHFRLLDPDNAPRVNVEKLLILIQPKPPELA